MQNPARASLLDGGGRDLRLVAGLAYFSCLDMEICAVTPPGNRNSTLLRLSSDEKTFRFGFVGYGFGKLQRRPLDDKIEVADTESRQHVPHGAACEEESEAGPAGGSCSSFTTLLWSALRWFSSIYM